MYHFNTHCNSNSTLKWAKGMILLFKKNYEHVNERNDAWQILTCLITLWFNINQTQQRLIHKVDEYCLTISSKQLVFTSDIIVTSLLTPSLLCVILPVLSSFLPGLFSLFLPSILPFLLRIFSGLLPLSAFLRLCLGGFTLSRITISQSSGDCFDVIYAIAHFSTTVDTILLVFWNGMINGDHHWLTSLFKENGVHITLR